MKYVLLGVIRLYQLTLSRVLPPTCRFHPSCSQYGYEAISRYGVWQGGWLAVKRLTRCHPFNPGGYDPVREPDGTRNTSVEFLDSDGFVNSSQVR